MIEQAAAQAGITDLTNDAPPPKQRGAKYWRAFIREVRDQFHAIHTERMEAFDRSHAQARKLIELQRQLFELQEQRATPLEMLICRARQGRDALDQCYRELSLITHPDRGGSVKAFQQLQADYESVCEAFNTRASAEAFKARAFV